MIAFFVFFITLSVLVLVHELGHFLAAKKAGIRVEEFGFGYPPRVLGKKIKGTIYSLNLLPFGGFVKLYGEELAEKKIEKNAFWAKSKKARTGVILAGVIANFILAVVCFSIVYSISGIPVKIGKVKIEEIAVGSPADKAGLEAGDLIVGVDDQKLALVDDFVRTVEAKKGQEINLMIERDKQFVLKITPRQNPPQGEGALGVIITDTEIKKFPLWKMPILGAYYGTREALGWGGLIVGSVGKMMADLVGRGVVPKDIAGPIGIYQASSQVSRHGFLAVLQFIGILSVNLAVLNILPFPALDGGRLDFIGYELITRKKPKPQIEHWINAVGMAVLLTLIVLVTIGDLKRLNLHWPF
ncbi:MAG: M50 family metallopeptidase [bacterium]|nr:M50 family metallopeptidase [bacterium]